jgi:hypothetical protein
MRSATHGTAREGRHARLRERGREGLVPSLRPTHIPKAVPLAPSCLARRGATIRTGPHAARCFGSCLRRPERSVPSVRAGQAVCPELLRQDDVFPAREHDDVDRARHAEATGREHRLQPTLRASPERELQKLVARVPEHLRRGPSSALGGACRIGCEQHIIGDVAPVADAASDAEPLTEHGAVGDLPNLELGDPVLSGQAWEPVGVYWQWILR